MRALAVLLLVCGGCGGLRATAVSRDGGGTTLGQGAFGIWEDRTTGGALGVDIVLHDRDSPACVAGCDDTASAAQDSVTAMTISLVTPPAHASFDLLTEPDPCGEMASGEPVLCAAEGSAVAWALLSVRPSGCTEPASMTSQAPDGTLVIETLVGGAESPSEIVGHVSFSFEGETWSGPFHVGHCSQLDYSYLP